MDRNVIDILEIKQEIGDESAAASDHILGQITYKFKHSEQMMELFPNLLDHRYHESFAFVRLGRSIVADFDAFIIRHLPSDMDKVLASEEELQNLIVVHSARFNANEHLARSIDSAERFNISPADKPNVTCGVCSTEVAVFKLSICSPFASCFETTGCQHCVRAIRLVMAPNGLNRRINEIAFRHMNSIDEPAFEKVEKIWKKSSYPVECQLEIERFLKFVDGNLA